MQRFVIGQLDDDRRPRIRNRKLEYSPAVAIDRVGSGRSLSGADENDLAAGLDFRQIYLVSFNDNLVRVFGGAQQRTIETKSDRADCKQVRTPFWVEKSHRQSPLK